jgi:hypothetical protein
MRCSLQDVFATHFDAYAQQRSLHPRQWRAAQSIRDCYTPACGSHTLRCPQGHFTHEQFHACGHRSCPRCAPVAQAAWIDTELARLLPCPHFHVIFTVPHELLPLWEFNRETFIRVLFDSVRLSLLELLADPRHLGATPGLLLSLHTWGRNLSHHPHIHALVSAGGLTPDLRWRPTRDGFLLPLKPLRRLFAGKLLAALRSCLDTDTLRLPPLQPRSHCSSLLQALHRKHWNIQINPAYDSGRSVTLYLARYTKGGPLPKQRALYVTPTSIRFEYTDHRDSHAKQLTLTPFAFIDRILWHAPPKGVHTVRHAGLYAAAAKRHHRQALIALTLPAPQPPVLPSPPHPIHSPCTKPAPLCPVCSAPLGLSYSRLSPRTQSAKNEIPLLESAHTGQHPSHHHLTARPNPSFKPTANGEPPGPGHRYPVHCLWPGPAGSPSSAT